MPPSTAEGTVGPTHAWEPGGLRDSCQLTAMNLAHRLREAGAGERNAKTRSDTVSLTEVRSRT